LNDAAFVWFPRRESPAYYDRLMHECFRGGLKSPHIVQEGVNEATILSLVSCGLGVAFVSSATRWRCPESVALLPVTDLKLPLPFALIWRKDNASPLLEKFVLMCGSCQQYSVSQTLRFTITNPRDKL
jgi:DNA-binding transcriptional LysR family regulator